MKQTLLLLALALGMFSISGSAQTKKPVRKTSTQAKVTKPVHKDSREYQVGDDGFEWYKVCKNGKYGAESKDGQVLIPAEFDNVLYVSYQRFRDGEAHGDYFLAVMGAYQSCYTSMGKCVIPYTRHFCRLGKRHSNNFGTYYTGYRFKPNAKIGTSFCDSEGNEICSIDGDTTSDLRYFDADMRCFDGKYYFEISTVYENSAKNGKGIADINGNIVIKPEHEWISYNEATRTFTDGNGTVIGCLSAITTTKNPFANNPRTDMLISETTGGQNSNSTPSANNQQGSSQGQSSTIVVEHHRDPVPVQEWQQCPACYGSGQCPNVSCGGSGWYYIGDKARTCSRCHGSGKCTICAGKGGQNVTVYR